MSLLFGRRLTGIVNNTCKPPVDVLLSLIPRARAYARTSGIRLAAITKSLLVSIDPIFSLLKIGFRCSNDTKDLRVACKSTYL